MICKLCRKQEARGSGTELCDGCWELDTRIKYDPDLAIKILSAMGYSLTGPVTTGLNEKPEETEMCMECGADLTDGGQHYAICSTAAEMKGE